MASAEQFFDAARQGNILDLTRLLSEDPSLLNVRNDMGQSAIMLAKYHRKHDAVDYLLAQKPELTLHEACAAGAADVVRGIVKDRGSKEIDTHSKDGFTPLSLACFFSHPEIASFLVDQGANVNLSAKNPMRVAPIHAAVAARQLEIVRMLLAAGADVNRSQQQGWTPLHAAAQNGDEPIVKLLLEYDADRQAKADNMQSPMDLALLQGHGGVVALLEG